MASNPEFQDYYRTLGVPRTATQAEIKKAFRKLARESHPDKHPGDTSAERRFKEINEANAVLSDPAKRTKYDQFGRDWEAYSRAGAAAGGPSGNPFGPGGPFAGFGGGAARSGAGPGGIRYEFRTSGDGGGFSEFFRMMFGDENAAAGEPERFARGGGGSRAGAGTTGTAGTESIDELLARMGIAGAPGAAAGNGRRPAARAKPQPIEVTAELTLEESFHGTSRIVDIDGRRLELTIPRGAATGSRIRLTGKGPNGADLIVVTKVKAHPIFARRGDDLEREVPVSLGEALLGAEVPVGTLKGRVLLKVPEGTQNGRTFRLKGQGMPKFKGDGAGDLFVKVRVVLPTDLDDESKAAARQLLDRIDQPDPREVPAKQTGST
jgi:curved DNA-binding protein